MKDLQREPMIQVGKSLRVLLSRISPFRAREAGFHSFLIHASK
jgi:hypothetical protein